VLVPVGLLSSSLRRRRWSEQLAWFGLLAMGVFSSLLVLTLLRDILLLAAWATGVGTAGFITTARSRCRCWRWRSAWSASSTRAAWRAW
jgi:hypothetical protein